MSDGIRKGMVVWADREVGGSKLRRRAKVLDLGPEGTDWALVHTIKDGEWRCARSTLCPVVDSAEIGAAAAAEQHSMISAAKAHLARARALASGDKVTGILYPGEGIGGDDEPPTRSRKKI